MTIRFEHPSLATAVEQSRPSREIPVPTASTAETAECECPDACERDHGND